MRYAYATGSYVYKLKGYSKKITQLVENGNFETDSGWDGHGNVNISVSNNVVSVPSNSALENYGIARNDFKQQTGHKYYCSLYAKTNNSTFTRLRFRYPILSDFIILTTSYQKIQSIGISQNLDFLLAQVFDGDVNTIISMHDIQVFDLTADFGAGKEPTTVEQCEAYYGNRYIPYGEQILNCKMPIKAYKNGVEVATIDCGRDLLFNDTLTTNGKVDIGSGKVDLGSLNYAYYSTYTSFVSNSIADIVNKDCALSSSALLCSGYKISNEWWTSSRKENKSISLSAYPTITVKDTSYDNAATFKTAMNGVILDYELAQHTNSTFTPIQLKDNLTFIDDNGYEVEVEDKKFEVKKWKSVRKLSKLPTAYQEVEYLESTGTQYIDTGYVPNKDDYISITCMSVIPNTNFIPFGSDNFTFVITPDGTIYMRPFSALGTIPSRQPGFNVWRTIYYNNLSGYMSIKDFGDGVMRGGVQPIGNLWLFGRSDTTYKSACRIKKYELYGKQEFIPCYRRSDHKPGMYDTVNNVFYTNQGTGEFILGEEIKTLIKYGVKLK